MCDFQSYYFLSPFSIIIFKTFSNRNHHVHLIQNFYSSYRISRLKLGCRLPVIGKLNICSEYWSKDSSSTSVIFRKVLFDHIYFCPFESNMLLLPFYLQVWVEKWKGAKTDCQETASAVNYSLAVILSKLLLAALIIILNSTHLYTFYFTNILHALSPLVLMKTQYRSGIVSSQERSYFI